MVNRISNFAIDGVNDFTAIDRLFQWFGGTYIEFIEASGYGDPTATQFTTTVTLSGDEWYTNMLRFAAPIRHDVTVTDSATAPANFRGINTLFFAESSDDSQISVDLRYTGVTAIQVSQGHADVTLAERYVNILETSGGDDSLTLIDGGGVGMANLGDGSNEVRVEEESNINALSLFGDGDNAVRLFGGNIDAMNIGNGNDTIIVRDDGNIDVVNGGDGVNKTTVRGGGSIDYFDSRGENTVRVFGSEAGNPDHESRIEALRLSDGDDTVEVTDGGRITQANVGSGNDTILVSGVNPDQTDRVSEIGQIIASAGNDTLTIADDATIGEANLGSGNDALFVTNGAEAGRIELNRGENSATYDGAGFSAFLRSEDDADTLEILGGSELGHASLKGGDNTILVSGNGSRLTTLTTFDEQDTLTVDDGGRIDTASLGGGDNVITIDNGAEVTTLNTFEGNDDLTLRNGAEIFGEADLGDGNNTVETRGAGTRIEWLRTGNGDDTVSLFGQSRIDSLHAGDGNDLVDIRQMARIDTIQLGQGMDTLETGQRYIDYVGSYEGMVHLDVGTGGIGSVALGDSTLGDHMVTTRGYIDQFRVNSQSTTHVTLDDTGGGTYQLGMGDDTFTATSNGDFVEFIKTREGADTVTLTNTGTQSIKTQEGADTIVINGDNGIGYVSAGDGNDTLEATGEHYITSVRMGAGDDLIMLDNAGGQVFILGDGDDTVIVKTATFGAWFQGRDGFDTVDLGQLGVALTVSLDFGIGYQNIGAPGGDPDLDGVGFFAFGNIEGLVGGAAGDVLEGSRYRDDGLDGAGGADMLSGLAGNDTLTGGRGADSLFGGEGDDTLQGNDGSDNMRGEAGNDLIEGNKGTDRIRGGSGEDTLDGGRSSDTLTGGADADTFILRQTSGSDHITDFTDDLDVLLLDSGLWAGTLTAQEVVDQFGTLRDGDVVLDFGSDEFVLRSVTDQNVLVDDIQIF